MAPLLFAAKVAPLWMGFTLTEKVGRGSLETSVRVTSRSSRGIVDPGDHSVAVASGGDGGSPWIGCDPHGAGTVATHARRMIFGTDLTGTAFFPVA